MKIVWMLSISMLLMAQDVTFDMPQPEKAMTKSERLAIGYDHMTTAQKKALDGFVIRFAVDTLNRYRESVPGMGE